MKKLTIILLCLALMASMAACAKPSDTEYTPVPSTQSTTPSTAPTTPAPTVTEPPATQPPITEPPVIEPAQPHEKFDAEDCKPLMGTWRTTITLDARIINLDQFNGRSSFDLYYSFTEDGQFRAYADETAFLNAIVSYEKQVVDHMVSLRYITFLGQQEWKGVTDPEIIQQLWAEGPEAEARQECEEFIATMNLYYRFAALLREGQYYVEGDDVFTSLADDSFESNGFKLKNNNLTLTDTSNPGVYRPLCIYFPLIFTPVS